MNRTSRTAPIHIALISALALLLPAAACKKDSGGSEAASSIMKALPSDSVAVGGANLGSLSKEGIIKAQLDKQMPPELKEFKEKCGIDIFSDVEQVLMSFKTSEEFVVGAKVGFDKAKAEKCIKEYGGEVSEEDGLTKTVIDGETSYMKWMDGGVVLMAQKKDSLAKAGEGDGLAGNKDVMKYVNKANTGATLWAAGAVPDSMKEEMGGQFPGNPPNGGYISIKADKNLDVSAGVVFPEAGDAENIKKMADQQMAQLKENPMIGQYVKKVELSQDGDTLKVDVKLSESDLKALQGLAGSMGGGF